MALSFNNKQFDDIGSLTQALLSTTEIDANTLNIHLESNHESPPSEEDIQALCTFVRTQDKTFHIQIDGHEAFNKPLRKLAEENLLRGESEHRTPVYTAVHEDSSIASTKQEVSSIEFLNRSNQKLKEAVQYQVLNRFAIKALEQRVSKHSRISKTKLDFVTFNPNNPYQVSVQIQHPLNPRGRAKAVAPATSIFTPSDHAHSQALDTYHRVTVPDLDTAQLKTHKKEIEAYLSHIDKAYHHLLAEMIHFGGEAYGYLFLSILYQLNQKKINIDFLKQPDAIEAFLTPKGIRNLEKLQQFKTPTKRLWWNNLITQHLTNSDVEASTPFEFNTYFETYNNFLDRLADWDLDLPEQCPENIVPMLDGLARILTVLKLSPDRVKQCAELKTLNWSSPILAEAMEQGGFKFVSDLMQLNTAEDFNVPATCPDQDLDTWVYRYAGKHWKLSLDLRKNLMPWVTKIKALEDFSEPEKNALLYVLTKAAFTNDDPVNLDAALMVCLESLSNLSSDERSALLEQLKRIHDFHPQPNLAQLNRWVKTLIELKPLNENAFISEIVQPVIDSLCLFDASIFENLLEQRQKSGSMPSLSLLKELSKFPLAGTASEDQINFARALSCIPHPSGWTRASIDQLWSNLSQLNGPRCTALLSNLAEINISKSKALPTLDQIDSLIAGVLSSYTLTGFETDPEKLKAQINLEHIVKTLPDCIIGNGDIEIKSTILSVVSDFFKSVHYQVANNVKNYIFDCVKVLDPQKDSYSPSVARVESLKNFFEAFNTFESFIQNNSNAKIESLTLELKKLEAALHFFFNDPGMLFGIKGGDIFKIVITDQAPSTWSTIFMYPLGTKIVSKLRPIFDKIKQDFPYQLSATEALDEQKLKRLQVRKWINAFEASPEHSISILFKDTLIERIKPDIGRALNALQTTNKSFREDILGALEALDTNIPASQGIPLYNAHITGLVTYLNALVKLQKYSSGSFESFLDIFTTGKLKAVPYTLRSTLLEQLCELHTKNICDLLKAWTLILSWLPDYPELADPSELKTLQSQWIERFERAVKGLKSLTTLPSDLPVETKLSLFQMSFQHNFNQTQPFPLEDMRKLQGLSFDKKDELLSCLIKILGFVSAETKHDALGRLFSLTYKFINTNPEQIPLLIKLLDRIPPKTQQIGRNSSAEKLNQNLNAFNQIFDQLQKLPHDGHVRFDHLTKILSKLTQVETADISLYRLSVIQTELLKETHATYFTDKILPLFNTPPYPQAQSLSETLNNGQIIEYCNHFELNPLGAFGVTRDIDAQFSTDKLADALVRLKDLSRHESFDLETQNKLAQQLTYITTTGKKYVQYTRQKLSERQSELFTKLKKPDLTVAQKAYAQLELLAVLREIFFRCSGDEKSGGYFLNSTQMLSLLMSLRDPSHLLMQINTGEGKSLIAPLLAVLQHLQGGTVDMCTANTILLERDYKHMCENFFTFLGIKSKMISKDSTFEDYQVDGINCSTIEDMALYRLRMKLMGQPIAPHKTHLILDECDYWMFDNGLLFNVVGTPDTHNAYAWVYPLVRRFILDKKYQRIDENKGAWTAEEDLEKLRAMLNLEASAEQKALLLKTEDKQLEQWLDAACQAEKKYHENQQFMLKDEEIELDGKMTKTGATLIIPIVNGVPKEGCSFPNGVHPALQIKLQEKYPEKKFRIEPYPPVLASQSAHGLLSFYQQTQGRLLGISGTPGAGVELKTLATQYGTRAISLPSHKGEQRKTLPPKFSQNRYQSTEEIKKTIQSIQKPYKDYPGVSTPYTDREMTPEKLPEYNQRVNKVAREWSNSQTQPILIITKDIEEALALQQSLTTNPKLSPEIVRETLAGYPPIKLDLEGFEVQVITGQEDFGERERKIRRAGDPDVITIGTSMLGRGIDFNPDLHEEGLFVISTCLKNEREMRQIAGRSARNGRKGVYQPIFQIQKPHNWFFRILYHLVPWYKKHYHSKELQRIQSELTREEGITRSYIQAVGLAQQVMMQQLDAWQDFLKLVKPQKPEQYLAWRIQLMDEAGKLQEATIQQHTLRDEIEKYKDKLCHMWERFKTNTLLEVLNTDEKSKLSFEHDLIFKCLQHSVLKEELLEQLPLHQASKRIQDATDKRARQTLEFTLQDPAGAIIEIDPSLTAEAKQNLWLEHANQLLPAICAKLAETYPAAQGIWPQSPAKTLEEIHTLLPKLLEAFQTYHHKVKTSASLKQQFLSQGLFLSFFQCCENIGFALENAKALKAAYDTQVFQRIAEHLCTQLKWVEQKTSLHVRVERNRVKAAANRLYDLAVAAKLDPKALYLALKEEHLALKDLMILSVGHRNTRSVIEETLQAIEVLSYVPDGCDQQFRQQAEHYASTKLQLTAFNQLLKIQKDSLPDNVYTQLNAISETSKPEPGLLLELRELIDLFEQQHKTHAKTSQSLKKLKKQIDQSIRTLEKNGPVEFSEAYLEDKATQLKDLGLGKVLASDGEIKLQSGHDGIQPYIELNVKNIKEDTAILESLIGYHSPLLPILKQKLDRVPDVNRPEKQKLTELLHAQNFRLALQSFLPPNALINLPWNTAVMEDNDKLFESAEAQQTYRKAKAEQNAILKKLDSAQKELTELEALHSTLASKVDNEKTQRDSMWFFQPSKAKLEESITEEEERLDLCTKEIELLTEEIQQHQTQLSRQDQILQSGISLKDYLSQQKSRIEQQFNALSEEANRLSDLVKGPISKERKKSMHCTRRFFHPRELVTFQEELRQKVAPGEAS